MRKLFAGALLVAFSSNVGAALIDRGEGFIYDDVLDITWTQDANINGSVNWFDQLTWTENYSQTHSVYGTFDDWRLPSMDVNEDRVIVDCESASEVGCRDNEYGYLYHQYGITPSTPGVFTNVQDAQYWSITVDRPDNTDFAWFFQFARGRNSTDSRADLDFFAWAVRDGDVAQVVPVPAAVWLFGSALAGLGWMRRK